MTHINFQEGLNVMSEKLLLLAILPVVTLVITLGWVWLLTSGRQTVTLSLHGLGLRVELTSIKEKEKHGTATTTSNHPK